LSQIKVEIILPLYYNDRTRIERYKFIKTYDEIIERFNGCTVNPTPLVGGWKDPESGTVYKNEENVLYYVICEDDSKNKEVLTNLKQILKERFQQNEIMMYITKVDVL
jgi:hypothetical protein